MPRYKPKFTATRDRNHGEISEQWSGRGLSVYDSSKIGGGFPDVIVGGPMPCPKCQAKIRQNIFAEIKVPGEELRGPDPRRPGVMSQIEFHQLWRGPIVIVRTIEEALDLGRKGANQ